MPSERVIERSPLWPPSPPPRLSRTAANGMSSSSWTTTRSLDGQVVVVAAARAPGRRTRSCRSSGRARTTRRPASRPSPDSARARAPLPGEQRGCRPGRPARRAPWRRRCAGCRRSPGRGCPARRRGTGPRTPRRARRAGAPAVPAPPAGRARRSVDPSARTLGRTSDRLAAALVLRPRRTTSPSPAPSAASSDSSRSMPASASASASSASRASAVGAPQEVDDQRLGVGDQRGALGSTRSPAVMFCPAARPVTSTSMLSGMLGGVGLDLRRCCAGGDGIVSGAASPTMTIGDLDGDLLAAADERPGRRARDRA